MEVRGYILEEENAAKQNGAEIVMNYCNLSMFPNTLLQNEYYQNNLKKLYLKRNCIKAINVSGICVCGEVYMGRVSSQFLVAKFQFCCLLT